MFQDLKQKFLALNVFGKIIAINCLVFLPQMLVGKLGVFQFFQLPSSFFKFILQPWSIITYAFLHADLFHLAFNMLLLHYLSTTLLQFFRVKQVLNIYAMGIVFGGVAFMLVSQLLSPTVFNVGGYLIGASAGVCAILLFVATYIPNTEIRLFGAFNVQWKYIALVFVVLDAVRMITGINQGGYVSHFGGYLLGYLYAKNLQQGKDIGKGFERIMDSVASWFTPKSKLKTVYKTKPKKNYAGKTKDEFNTYNNQKKIDLILDKISKSGYESLTAEEKEFIFKAGK